MLNQVALKYMSMSLAWGPHLAISGCFFGLMSLDFVNLDKAAKTKSAFRFVRLDFRSPKMEGWSEWSSQILSLLCIFWALKSQMYAESVLFIFISYLKNQDPFRYLLVCVKYCACSTLFSMIETWLSCSAHLQESLQIGKVAAKSECSAKATYKISAWFAGLSSQLWRRSVLLFGTIDMVRSI